MAKAKTTPPPAPTMWVIFRDAVTDTGKHRGLLVRDLDKQVVLDPVDPENLKSMFGGCEFSVRTSADRVVIAGFAERVTDMPLRWAFKNLTEDSHVILYKDQHSDTFAPVAWREDLKL